MEFSREDLPWINLVKKSCCSGVKVILFGNGASGGGKVVMSTIRVA